MSIIEKIYLESRGTYGSPRIHQELRARGIRIGRKRVARLMRKRGIKARCARIYHSKRGIKKYFSGIPNRSLEVIPVKPNQVWVSDITYLKVGGQWRYLAAVMDKFSRRIIGCSVSKNKDAVLTLRAFNEAVDNRKPQTGVIFHTDRGTEYGTFIFRDRLSQVGFVQSMNRPNGKMTDNSFMESFFHTMKAECIHGEKFTDDQEISSQIWSYIPFYNSKRMHSALGYLSPEVYELKTAL